MLKKNKKNRIVILGSSSFIARSIIDKFYENNIQPILISRKEIDLEKATSIPKLKKILKNNDTIIFVAAKSPVKNIETLNINLVIAKNIIESLQEIKLNHLIYISSDAVYSDHKKKINEFSATIPNTLHGFMHLIRETMLKNLNCPKTFIRPTLVYGVNDPHNSYGINKFVRCAQSGKEIFLFGRGEERRDHIHVDNVGEIVVEVVISKITGVINAVSGSVISFYKIAKNIQKIYPSVKIKKIKRIGIMPHKGYRPFNNSLLKKKFSHITFIKLFDWLSSKEIYKLM
jgi:nucleoside-diphosphate-sugar epimerase